MQNPSSAERLAALAAEGFEGVTGGGSITPAGVVTADFTPEAIKAARLLGHDQPWRRVPTSELLIEGEYHLSALAAALAEGSSGECLAAYHRGELDGIGAECNRRLKRANTYQAPTGLTAERIAAIKAAVPCYEYVDSTRLTRLHRKGGDRWEGCCPFPWHQDTTPSFSAWASHFKCFGCDRGGDVFALVMQLDGVSFRDAARLLADYAGLPDPIIVPAPLPRVVG